MPDAPLTLAYGHHGLRMTSTDGERWSGPVLGDSNHIYRDAVYGEAGFVAVVKHGGSSLIANSRDGVSWEKPVDIKADDLTNIAYGGGRYVAVGGYSPSVNKVVFTHSEDGRKWAPAKEEKKSALTSLIYGGGKFLASGIKGRVAISEDGGNWTDAKDRRALDSFISIAYGAGVYVGTGLHGLRMTSRDGLQWNHRQLGEEGEHINSILYTGKQFVGVGLGATYFSEDGLTWTRRENENAPLTAVYDGRRYIGSNWKGRIFTSADAVLWKQVTKAEHHVTGFAVKRS